MKSGSGPTRRFLNGILLHFLACSTLFFTACRKDSTVAANDYKTLGSSAHNFLSASNYTTLHIQVSYMPGYQPDAAALDQLKYFLNKYLNKPGGIQISEQQIAASGKESLTLSEIVAIERTNRADFTNGNTIAVHILITDGSYVNAKDLALSYWNTSFCLFGKDIWHSGTLARTSLLSTLFEHEFGHLLGLVAQGSPEVQPHRDAANGAHCSNNKCLMYYAVEANTVSSSVPDLDANCQADLKANGGK